MKYLKLFDTHSNYETFAGDTLNPMIKPNVSHCVQENEVHYNPFKYDYSKDYLTIESLEDDNAICWEADTQFSKKTISASTDNGQTWTAFTASYYGEGEGVYHPTTIATLNAGEKVLVKGENASYGESRNTNRFRISNRVNISGNIMSLIHGDMFVINNTLSSLLNFYYMFSSCNIVSAKNLILPATTLTLNCYEGMFSLCSNLTTAPELPATTLASCCYEYMFAGCTSLSKYPIVSDRVARPINSLYCCGMYAETSLPHSEEYSEFAYDGACGK